MSKPSNDLNDALKETLSRTNLYKSSNPSLENRVIESIRQYQVQRRRVRKTLSLCTCVILIAVITWTYAIFNSGKPITIIDGPGLVLLNSKPVQIDAELYSMSVGSKLNTQTNQVLVRLSDDEQIILNRETTISLIEKHTVQIDMGQIRYRNKSSNHQTVFMVPNGSITPLGTEFDLLVSPQHIELILLEGEAEIQIGSQRDLLQSGQKIQIKDDSSQVEFINAQTPEWWNINNDKPWTDYLKE
ncbi:MAG: hypothetical protein P9L94_08910 [Candidatus Hinthialibacter antarcticus]|nr:hypothetical protein [Candidatus Hinthialibacter antarcticus]